MNDTLSRHRQFIIFGVMLLAAGACSGTGDRTASADTLGAASSATAAATRIASATSATATQAPSRDSAAGNQAMPPRDSASRPAPKHAPATAPAAPRGPRRVTLGDVDLTGIGYDRGSPDAPVVVIDFSDFGCPYCGQFTRESYPAIEREYVNTGKVFFKYVPFIVGMFPHSAEATRAAECTAEQGRFWPMADHLYEAQKAWKGGGDPRLLLTAIAGVVGADTTVVSKCYADRHTDARTARATEAANRLGVRVTPSFIVNERPIEGALPLAEFRKVLDAALLVKAAK